MPSLRRFGFVTSGIIIFIIINDSEASSIYSHVGDDVLFSWALNPVPDINDIINIQNPNGKVMFYVSGTVAAPIEAPYTRRIVYNGNTAMGQMEFTLKQTTRLDAGVYIASKAGSAGSPVYQGPTLFVLGKPTKPFVTELSPPVVNKTLQLNCSTSSTTVPGNHNLSMTYSWNIDGVNITGSTGRYSFYSSRISIQNVSIDDKNKTVHCTGTEERGLTSDKSNIYVLDPLYGPGAVTFSPSTTNYSLPEQRTIPEINCTADCKPNCSYRWTKDGQDTSHGSGRILSLRNINRNDTGVYRCTAWNDHGTKNSSDIYVDVKYGPLTVLFTPSTTRYSPTELETVPDITCTADCKPNCSYRWTKDGQVTSYSSGSTLSLRNVNRNETGVYRCTAWNDHGTKNSSDINVDVQYGPGTITFTPSTTSYSITELVTIPNITCTADCKPSCSYRWTKDGQVTSRGSGSTLSLRNVNLNDTGVYRCTARNDHGTKNSSDINVDVKHGPVEVTFTPSFTSYSPTEGETLSIITCTADCKPNCSYRWTKDGQVASHSSGSTLSLRKINRNNTGLYRCTAWNDHGTKNSSDINVDVEYGPGDSARLMPRNKTYTFIENTTVSTEIECQADCKPGCTYRWNYTASSNPLIFGKVQRSQAGKYVCTSMNKVGSSEVSIILIVQYPSRVTTNSVAELNIKEGLNTTFKCFIDAIPLPTAVWSKDNGTTFSVASKPSNPSLFQIDNANCVDTGNYTCTVDNQITNNSLDYRTYRLIVNCMPRLKMLQTNPKPVSVATSQGLNISTIFIGYPLPNITWRFKDEPIENNGSVFVTKTKEFEILSRLSKDTMSEDDFGIYTVVAENKFGKAISLYNVQAQRKPDAATNIIASCVSSERANISFVPGFNGGAKQIFFVIYNSSDISHIQHGPIIDRGKNTTVSISGLITETKYAFKIISSNAFGNTSTDSEETCLTKGKIKLTPDPPFAVIGGITGSVSGLILILSSIAFGIILLMRRKKKTSGNNDRSIQRPADNYEDEMKDNVLYEPAGPNYVKPEASRATTGGNEYPHTELQQYGEINGKPADVYAQVQKKRNKETDMIVDPNAIYSQVQKPKKGDGGMVYENFDIKTQKKRKPKQPKAKSANNKNTNELNYADLVFAPSGSGKAFVIHGSENKTNYVDIDFSKKGEPLPPENEETADEKTEI